MKTDDSSSACRAAIFAATGPPTAAKMAALHNPRGILPETCRATGPVAFHQTTGGPPALQNSTEQLRSARVCASGAFTLLEAMLAVAIFGLLMLAVAAVWNTSWSATERIATREQVEKRPELVLRRLGEAARTSIYHRKSSAIYAWNGQDDGGGSEESDSVSFTTSLPPDVGESMPEFSPPERISLSVRRGEHGRELVMLAAPFTMEEDDWQRETVLVEDVGAFHVEYWDKNQNAWVGGWTAQDHAPEAVMMAISLPGEPVKSASDPWLHSLMTRVRPSLEMPETAAGSTNATSSAAATGATNTPPAAVP